MEIAQPAAGAPVVRVPRGWVYGMFAEWPRRLRPLYQALGPVVRVVEEGADYVFISAPPENRQLLSQPDLFHTTEADSAASLSPRDSALFRLSEGILSMNGSRHREQRHLMMPAFHRGHVGVYGDLIVRWTERHLDAWRPGEVRDMRAEMSDLVLAILMDMLFGLDVHGDGAAFTALVRRFHEELFALIPDGTTPVTEEAAYPGVVALAEEVEGELHALIAAARAAPGRPDVLSMLVSPRAGGGMTDEEVAAQMLTLYIAGHESVAIALASVLLLIAQHPESAAELQAELDGALGGRAPEVAGLDRLPFLDAVIRETLRLLPGTPWAIRVASEPAEMGPYRVPPGAAVVYSPYVTQRDPALYPQPDRFLPARWRTLDPSPYEYLPFAAGRRMCIGYTMSMVWMKLILGVLYPRFRLSVRPGARIDRGRPDVDGHLPMVVHPPDGLFARAPIGGNICELIDFG
ncbi:MAG: cytochrome P450 [Gemmatimonadetes bacterium]|nr:cytochrome P450 [Gemmatimonadota bacterium]